MSVNTATKVNPFEEAVKQIERVAKRIGISDDVIE
jgi:hypothetical protein